MPGYFPVCNKYLAVRTMSLLNGHTTEPPVKLDSATSTSQVEFSTIETLCSSFCICINKLYVL